MFNKYHKAKLKTKQQRWFTPIKYLILSILPLTIDFALKSISKSFKEININFEVPNFLFEPCTFVVSIIFRDSLVFKSIYIFKSAKNTLYFKTNN